MENCIAELAESRYESPNMAAPPPSRFTKSFALRLAACRVAAGYETAEGFANHIKIEPHRYRRYERGEVEPPFEVLVLIADALEKSIDFLIRGSDGQSRNQTLGE